MQQHINTFTGETIIYDDQYHTYYSTAGVRLLGASSYAKRFAKPFPKEAIIEKLTKTWDMPARDIEQMWSINGEISNSYGTAIHAAMELWYRYHKKGKEIQTLKNTEQNYALPKNVYIRNIVLDFVSAFGELDITPEVALSCVRKGMAGRTDGVRHIGDKTCRVIDFKTNNDMSDDKLLGYQHQLSFYADMLQEAGWTVEGLDIYYHDGDGWHGIELPVLPVVLDDMPTDKLSTVGRRPPVFKGV
jgi:hypothetical protein